MYQEPLFPEWQPGPRADELEKLTDLRAFDELGRLAERYRNSRAFGKLLDFIIHFSDVSPYNAALLHLQKPQAAMVRSAVEWSALGRSVNAEARPALLLYPGGPLRFVFDVSETSGPPLAKEPREKANTAELLQNTIERAARLGVTVSGPLFGPEPAGRLRRAREGASFEIRLDEESDAARYATLVYELARLFLGHLGGCEGCSWENRPPHDDISGRFEAGAVAAIVCGRANIATEAGGFVLGYLRNFGETPEVSLDRILASAGRIERMGRR